MTRCSLFALGALLAMAGCSSSPGGDAASGTSTTAAAGGYAGVQAIFDRSCTQCHGAGSPKGGIDLRSYESVMKGGNEGAVVVAGDGAGSALVQALRGTGGKKQMPFMQSALPEEEIAQIQAWIQDGAKQ